MSAADHVTLDCGHAFLRLLREFEEPIYRGSNSVQVDGKGRCTLLFALQRHRSLLKLDDQVFWPAWRAVKLAEEVAEVVGPLAKLKSGPVKVHFYRSLGTAGKTYPLIDGAIFVDPFNVTHPMDIINTVIHEIAHLKVNELGHDECEVPGEGHCGVWKEANKLLIIAFKVSLMMDIKCINNTLFMPYNKYKRIVNLPHVIYAF